MLVPGKLYRLAPFLLEKVDIYGSVGLILFNDGDNVPLRKNDLLLFLKEEQHHLEPAKRYYFLFGDKVVRSAWYRLDIITKYFQEATPGINKR